MTTVARESNISLSSTEPLGMRSHFLSYLWAPLSHKLLSSALSRIGSYGGGALRRVMKPLVTSGLCQWMAF